MSIMEQLNAIFRTVFADPSLVIAAHTTAENVDGWDSLSHINLMVAVERHFKIRFTQKEITSFKNVGELASAIEAKVEPSPA